MPKPTRPTVSVHMPTLILAEKDQLLIEYLHAWSVVILFHVSPRVSNGRLETLVLSLIASTYRKEKKRRHLDNHVNVSMFSLR